MCIAFSIYDEVLSSNRHNSPVTASYKEIEMRVYRAGGFDKDAEIKKASTIIRMKDIEIAVYRAKIKELLERLSEK